MAGIEADFSSVPSRLRELFVFSLTLLILELFYFADALRPGRVLSPADALLVTESFRSPGALEYEPSNRLLTDIVTQTDPWMRLVANEWRAGRVPLWNPLAGCGAPLLGNAQSSALFPINFIYFLAQSPYAWVVMALVKLYIAGLGAFLLARQLGLGRTGRWFVGLCFPFSGFVTVWLLYALGNVAIWLPWLLWRVEKLAQAPGPRSAAWLAVLICLAVLGGHPETTAHVLLLTGVYMLWQCGRAWSGQATRHAFRWFAAASVVGILAAGVQIIPLAEYLRSSQAWVQRRRELEPPWKLSGHNLLAMPALAVPYVYGSYCKGHPHVEKALGVDNFNEIAGGYTGLATIAVLLPLAWQQRRRYPWVRYWIALDLAAIAIAHRFPVVDNLLRLIPVLNITANQRLLLGISLAHCLLGAAGLEALALLVQPQTRRLRIALVSLLLAGAASLGAAAWGVNALAPQIQRRAVAHYRSQAARRGLEPTAFRHRAERMSRQTTDFFPRYYGGVAVYAALLAAAIWLAGLLGRPSVLPKQGPELLELSMPVALLVLNLSDLFLFGRNYNPAIPIERYFPVCPATEFLRRQRGPFRVLPLEEEFPPNVLAVYGIADLRNYDALELRGQVAYFRPLWDRPGERLTSNSWTPWNRLLDNSRLLGMANVRYLISTTEPPDNHDGIRLVHQHGTVRIYKIRQASMFWFVEGPNRNAPAGARPIQASVRQYRPGYIETDVLNRSGAGSLVVSEAYIAGWNASVDGTEVPVEPHDRAWISLPIGPGRHRVVLEYAPASYRLGMILSSLGLLALAVLFLAGHGPDVASRLQPLERRATS